MSRGFASNHRIVVLAGGIFLCFGVLAARLVSLHVLDRDELLKYVEQARRSFVVDNARRGNIRDARGEILAASRTLIDVGLDPHMLRPADEARWPALAQLLGVTVTDLRAAAARRTVGTPAAEEPEARPMQWIKLASEVDEGVYEKVMELKIRGIYGNRIYRRFYPHKTLAAHVIGYVNKEGAPAAGVEHYMDFFLRGQNGWRESERDGRRQERAEFRTREVPTIDGCDVVLSLDTYVQHVIEEELQHLKETYEPQKATVIVSDANTGFILGLANLPTFDLNEFNQAPLDVLRNYAVTDVLEPGSTFKIVAASGALNERLVTPNSAFDCSEAEADYHGRHLRLPRDDHPSQELTVAGIISHSSNRGAVHLGMLLGPRLRLRGENGISLWRRGRRTARPAETLGWPDHHAPADGTRHRRDADADPLCDGCHRQRRGPAAPAADPPGARGQRRPGLRLCGPAAAARDLGGDRADHGPPADGRDLPRGHGPRGRHPGLRSRGQDRHDPEDHRWPLLRTPSHRILHRLFPSHPAGGGDFGDRRRC
jgi:cell division protein FtsI/penicillin-binding protein 2